MERERPAGGPIVRGFTAGGFRVGDAVYPALLMTVEEAIAWTPPTLDALTIDDLAPILTPVPEFVLIGTGVTLAHPPAALVKALDERGIGIEAMDSRAAARAWGVLRGEGRGIAAALLPL
jgi:uncharacterized protein